MDQPWFPDATRSRAVLIGVSRFQSEELPAIPAVRANLHDLRAALTHSTRGSILAKPADGCRVLGDDADQADVGAALASASKHARDLLLVYYSGHGLLDDDGRLHLAVRTTNPEHLGWTAIPIELIKRELGQARAKARVLVLDCCFSGQAVEAMADSASLAAGQLRLTGTFTLTSTTANDPSHAPRGSRNTAFTGALLRALANPEPLTLERIYRYTDDELVGLGLPRPQCRSVNTVRDLVLVRGPVSAPDQPEPAPSPRPAPRPNVATATPRRPQYRDDSISQIDATLSRFAQVHAELSQPRPQKTRPLLKAILAIPSSVVFAFLAWTSFTDPYRNVHPSWFEIAVGWVFGLMFATGAILTAIRAVVWLRRTLRPPRTPR